MAIVRLTEATQFLEELQHDRVSVDRRIVRIAEVSDQGPGSPGLCYRRLVVTARVGHDILRLDWVCGATCGVREHDERVTAALTRQRQTLHEGCAALGLDVRPGILEDACTEHQ